MSAGVTLQLLDGTELANVRVRHVDERLVISYCEIADPRAENL